MTRRHTPGLLDASALLERLASKTPAALREHIVIVGSIAAAWAYKDLPGGAKGRVATKDIDVLLQPSVDAVATAQDLSERLLNENWTPIFPEGQAPATADTPIGRLPGLRLEAPGESEGWFIELLAEPPPGQTDRRVWREIHTAAGRFAIPSFRYLSVAIFGAELTRFGLRVALPASMAFANLLAHSVPDTAPFQGSDLPRYAKDVGRAVALYWMAEQASGAAADQWTRQLVNCVATIVANDRRNAMEWIEQSILGLRSIDDIMDEACSIATQSVLAPFGTSPDEFRRSWARLERVLRDVAGGLSKSA